MNVLRIAGIGFSAVVASTTALAQQPRGPATAGGSPAPAETVLERSYPNGGVIPWRHAETRTVSGGREVVRGTTETPVPDGRWTPAGEVVTETVHGAGSAQTRQDVFGFGEQGRRVLIETTESEQTTGPGGATRTIANTSRPDLDGHLDLTSRVVEERRASASGAIAIDTTVFLPGINSPVEPAERREESERRVGQDRVQRDSTLLVRDINGRWQPIEARSEEARIVGSSERVSEETVRQRDVNGNLAVVGKNVTRRSEGNGQEQVVTETYAQNAEGFRRLDDTLALSQRVRRTTTVAADGSSQTVEEIEARNPAAPGDGMRVVRRTVSTARPGGANRQAVTRDVFELGVNGGLVLISRESEVSTY